MTSRLNRGRLVGLLYLLISIPGFFALFYVPNKLIVSGDADATAHNIAASETLFRAGIACNLLGQILFMGVALALYDLFKSTNRRQAAVMLGLLVTSIPIALLNELNAFAALLLIHGAAYLNVFDLANRNAMAMFFLQLHDKGFVIAEIFWGLWLFPLGLLVYKSRFLPRILGALLALNCISYVMNSLCSILVPQFAQAVSVWLKPFGFGELIFMLWLLIVGAEPKLSANQPTSSS
jgi:hypothetical protein